VSPEVQEIERDLLRYIEDELGVPGRQCRPDAPLFSSGVLDSFAMVSLLVFAEERFGVSLIDSDAMVAIDTAGGLARHVHRSLTQ